MDATPSPKHETVTPPGEDDEDLDDDPFLADTSNEDFHDAASPADDHEESALDLYSWELALARKRRIAIGIAIALATIAVPLLYLFLSGDLRGLRHEHIPQTAMQKRQAAVKSQPQVGSVPNHMITLDPTPTPPPTPAQIAHDKQVKQDLENYLQQGTRTTPDESVAMKALASVSGSQFKSNDIALQTLQSTVLPHYALFLANISAMHPQTPEVQAVHHVLMESTRLKMLAFQHMQEGLRAKDSDQLWQYGFRSELDQSTQFAQDYRTKIVDLASARGVTLP